MGSGRKGEAALSNEERDRRIRAVEDDPRHSRAADPERADRETATDPIDDERFQKRDGQEDPRQKRIRPDVISHPDWDDE
jgi:hypothetical protein